MSDQILQLDFVAENKAIEFVPEPKKPVKPKLTTTPLPISLLRSNGYDNLDGAIISKSSASRRDEGKEVYLRFLSTFFVFDSAHRVSQKDHWRLYHNAVHPYYQFTKQSCVVLSATLGKLATQQSANSGKSHPVGWLKRTIHGIRFVTYEEFIQPRALVSAGESKSHEAFWNQYDHILSCRAAEAQSSKAICDQRSHIPTPSGLSGDRIASSQATVLETISVSSDEPDHDSPFETRKRKRSDKIDLCHASSQKKTAAPMSYKAAALSTHSVLSHQLIREADSYYVLFPCTGTVYTICNGRFLSVNGEAVEGANVSSTAFIGFDLTFDLVPSDLIVCGDRFEPVSGTVHIPWKCDMNFKAIHDLIAQNRFGSMFHTGNYGNMIMKIPTHSIYTQSFLDKFKHKRSKVFVVDSVTSPFFDALKHQLDSRMNVAQTSLDSLQEKPTELTTRKNNFVDTLQNETLLAHQPRTSLTQASAAGQQDETNTLDSSNPDTELRLLSDINSVLTHTPYMLAQEKQRMKEISSKFTTLRSIIQSQINTPSPVTAVLSVEVTNNWRAEDRGKQQADVETHLYRRIASELTDGLCFEYHNQRVELIFSEVSKYEFYTICGHTDELKSYLIKRYAMYINRFYQINPIAGYSPTVEFMLSRPLNYG